MAVEGSVGGWRVPPAAWLLGLTGLLPFLGLAALAAAGEAWARAPLLLYGGAILSFLGAVHWGAALRAPTSEAGWDWPRFGLGVLPSLIAWVALQLPPVPATLLLAGAILGTAGLEAASVRSGATGGDWVRLRWVLSIGAALSLLAGQFI